MSAISAFPVTVPSDASSVSALSTPAALLFALITFLLAATSITVVVHGIMHLVRYYRQSQVEDAGFMRLETSTSDAKSPNGPFLQRMALSAFLFRSSRRVPTLFITSPTVDLKEYAQCPTDIRFDIPLIGQAPFVGQRVGVAYHESAVPFKAPLVKASESEYTEVSCFEDSLKDCEFDLSMLALLAQPSSPPSASGTATEDIFSGPITSPVSASPSAWYDDLETDADVGMAASDSSPEDPGARPSDGSSYPLSTPMATDRPQSDGQLTEGYSVPSVADITSVGRLGKFFGNDCSSESRSSASFSVYSCDSARGGSFPVHVLSASPSRAPTSTPPNPVLDQSLPLEVWERYAGDLKAEADWNSILMRSSYESDSDSSSSDCSFHLPMTPPQVPAEPKRARIAREKGQTILGSAKGTGLEAWWTEESCSFDLFASTKRYAIYVGKDRYLGFP